MRSGPRIPTVGLILWAGSALADTPTRALRLGRLLKTSPQFWMRLQADWDLHQAIKRESRAAS